MSKSACEGWTRFLDVGLDWESFKAVEQTAFHHYCACLSVPAEGSPARLCGCGEHGKIIVVAASSAWATIECGY